MVLPSPSRPLTRTFLVTVAWLAAVAGAVALVFSASAGTALPGGSPGFSLSFAGLALAVATYASVGAVLMLRRPGNVVGLVLMVAAILLAVTFLGFPFGAVLTEQRGKQDAVAGLASLLAGVGIYPAVIVAGPLVALVFPDGRLPPGPRWRRPVAAIAATLVLGSAIVIARPGPLGGSLADNPFGVSGFTGSEALWPVGETLAATAMLLALILAFAAVVVRFRRSGGVERAQLKWFVAAQVATGAVLTLSFADGATQTVVDVMAPWFLSLPTIAVGIAILRYRLYDIERLISRTVSWAVVTGMLVITFAVGVVALQTILGRFTQGQALAVAASTLAAAALFQPVRRRVQSVVDRRFNRSQYDTKRTVEGFAAGLSHEFDIERLGGELGAVVGRALAPSSVGVWLRPSVRVPGR